MAWTAHILFTSYTMERRKDGASEGFCKQLREILRFRFTFQTPRTSPCPVAESDGDEPVCPRTRREGTGPGGTADLDGTTIADSNLNTGIRSDALGLWALFREVMIMMRLRRL